MKKVNKNRRNVQKNVNYDSDNQLFSLFKIVGVLGILFAVFYGITIWKTKGNVLDNDDVEEVTIQYDEILVGTLLKQSEKDYYILVADINGNDYSKYDVYVSMFDTEMPKIYTSDIKNVFNQSYVGEETNVLDYVGKSSIENILFNDVTLLHVKKSTNKKKQTVTKITEAFVGAEDVVNAFKKVVS